MIKKQCQKGFCDNDSNICFCDMFQENKETISKGSVNMNSLKQSNTNKDTFTHKKVKNPCGKSLKISNTKQQNNAINGLYDEIMKEEEAEKKKNLLTIVLDPKYFSKVIQSFPFVKWDITEDGEYIVLFPNSWEENIDIIKYLSELGGLYD